MPKEEQTSTEARKQAADKKKYVALKGIDFNNMKPAVRVEAGEAIPSGLSSREIQDLLAISAIKEK